MYQNDFREFLGCILLLLLLLLLILLLLLLLLLFKEALLKGARQCGPNVLGA